ncbi:hypothetical protein [Cognatishimia sp.]|uniref:hypothetical protein n=1 Tax=Cognatishimia sp. TaxID=2211648 RepID=UPI003512DB6F
MNPGVLFLPFYRASTTAFLLGLLVLAVIDFARLSSGVPLIGGWLGMLAVWFFVFSLHANRLRYVERGSGLAMLPLGIAVLVKGIAAFFGVATAVYQQMLDYATANGFDANDPVVMQELSADQQFMEAVVAHIQSDEAVAAQIMSASSTPSFMGFWLVIALFAIWFAQMKRLGGSLKGVRDTTPSMMNPEPLAPSEPAPAPAEVAEETAPGAAEAAPAEEAPVEAAPVEDEPVVEAPAEDTPAEDAAPEDTASDDKSKD